MTVHEHFITNPSCLNDPTPPLHCLIRRRSVGLYQSPDRPAGTFRRQKGARGRSVTPGMARSGPVAAPWHCQTRRHRYTAPECSDRDGRSRSAEVGLPQTGHGRDKHGTARLATAGTNMALPDWPRQGQTWRYQPGHGRAHCRPWLWVWASLLPCMVNVIITQSATV